MRGENIEDGEEEIQKWTLTEFMATMLGIAERVHLLLKNDLERRSRQEEEERLASEQEMYMNREFCWKFQKDKV